MAAAKTECQIILHLLRASRDYLGRAEYSSLSTSENSPKQEKAGRSHKINGLKRNLKACVSQAIKFKRSLKGIKE